MKLDVALLAEGMIFPPVDLHLLLDPLILLLVPSCSSGGGGAKRVEEGISAFRAEEVEFVVVPREGGSGGRVDGEEAFVDDGGFAGVAAGCEEL